MDEIIDGMEGIHDQAFIREAIAQGREWKTKLDILLKGLHRIPEIDIEALWEGRPQRPSVSGPRSPSAVGPDDAKLLRRLVARFQDNEVLDDFELIYRNTRVKMNGGSGLDLIYPAEMKLLERLSGVEGKLYDIGT